MTCGRQLLLSRLGIGSLLWVAHREGRSALAHEVPGVNRKQLARDLAEGALKDAAMRLLRRDGVLAGLNMREVAAAASVNAAEAQVNSDRPEQGQWRRQVCGHGRHGTVGHFQRRLKLERPGAAPLPFGIHSALREPKGLRNTESALRVLAAF
jgi:hypothetical protein